MSSQHRHHILATATGIAAAWVFAVSPRVPFMRRAQSASRIPRLPHKDPAPLVPNTPFAHRGLHDAGSGYPSDDGEQMSHQLHTYYTLTRQLARKAGYGKGAPKGASIAPENSLAAFEAACRGGYGIELDLQMTRDGHVVVFHDDTLQRATRVAGSVADYTYEQLCHLPLFSTPLTGGSAGFASGDSVEALPYDEVATRLASWQSHIPLFSDVLKLVNGRVPLIVEYKARGAHVPPDMLEKGDQLLRSYAGSYVVESFDPLAMGWYRVHNPRVIRGQLACQQALSTHIHDAPSLATRVTDSLGGAALADCISRPDFLAMDWHMWDSTTAAIARDMGAQSVAWTVRSMEEALQCVDRFDRIIFEGFIPQLGVFGRGSVSHAASNQ